MRATSLLVVSVLFSLSLIAATNAPVLADTSGDLTLEITGTPDPARINDRITMELLFCNTGATDATGVVISGVVPAGVAFAVVTDGATCTSGGCGGGSTLTWDLDTLLAHRCSSVNLSMLVGASAVDDTALAFTFDLDVDGGATVSDTFTVTADSTSALAVEIADDADPVAGGDTIQYTVAYANRSAGNVLNGSLSASVPAGTTLVSVEDGGTEAGGTITWPLGTVSAGESGRRRFSVTVDAPAVDGSVILADAAATGTGESARATQATAVVATETLSAHVTANPDAVAASARLAYDITFCNAGVVELTGLFVDSIVPNGVSFPVAPGASCTTGGCGAGGRLSWDLDTLGAGRCQTLPLSFFGGAVADGALVRPTFRVRADGGALSSATRTFAIDSSQKLVLALSDDREPVAAGETLTYTLTYGVAATENALNTTLRAWVPEGTTLLSIDGGGTEAGGVITWTLGTLRAGESGQRRFTVTVDPAAVDGSAVDALAEIDEDSGATFGATATQSSTVNGEGTLTLRMTAHQDPTRGGARVLYDMTACNPGLDDATGVALDTVVPNGIAFPVSHPSDNVTCTTGGCGAGGYLSWDLGDLGARRCRTVQVSMLNSFATDASLILLTARLQADNRQTAVAGRVVVSDDTPSLVLGLVEDREPVVPSGVLTYTIVAANPSAENVTATTLRFFVPAGATITRIGDGGTEAAGVVTWDLGTMAAGDAVARKVVVTLGAGNADGTSVLAEADLAGGSTEKFGARASQATSVVSAETLTLDLIPHFEPTRVGDTVYSELVACNRGATDATGVALGAIVPNFVAFARSSEASAICSTGGCGAGGLIRWTVGELLAGRCRTIGMTQLLNSGTVGDLFLPTARIIADGGSVAIAARAIAVNTAQPLTSFVSEAADPSLPGADTSFDVTFGNRSASTFSNGELRVTLPPGATVVSASTGVVVDGNELSWGVCPMSAGQSGKYSYTVTLDDSVALPNGTGLLTDVQFAGLDGNPPASHAAASTAVADAAPLSLEIVTTPADIAKASDLITYDLNACNNGAGQATGVQILMFVPRGTGVSAIDDGGVTNAAGEIVWSVDAINATECATVSATVAVSAGASYVGDGTVLFSSARLLADGGETATDTHALRACSTTLAACTVKPPPPCGAPQSRACNRTASDALAVLRTAVGLRTCPLCECDIDNLGTVTASDALATLRFSVGQAVTLRCPACLPVQ